MNPTLSVGDRIVTNRHGTASRGSVIAFTDPGGWIPDELAGAGIGQTSLDPSQVYLVKRVVGVGGDTVTRTIDGRILVNGHPETLPPGARTEGAVTGSPFTVHVPAGQLWVLGDNRTHSDDSPTHQDTPGHGFVPVSDVVGVAVAVVWPWGHLRRL